MSKRKVFIPTFVLFLTFLSVFYESAQGQIVGSETLQFRNFTFHNKPPKYLLSTKSVVFISVPRSNKNPTIRSDWKNLSEQLHKKFRQMKIDAVGYYYLDDVFNNLDPSLAFAKEMAAREIKYLILVDQSRDRQDATGKDTFRIIVTPFNDESSFVDENSNAWKVEGNDLNALLKGMFNTIHGADLEVENYLIPDIPEFFTDTDIIRGKRIETYAMDLKVEKLIVPKFQKYVSKDSSKLDEEIRNKIKAYNLTIDKKNERLAEIMKTYPLSYEISDEFSEKEVYNKGGQFVLLRIYGTGKSIKEILNYKIDEGETVYATIKATEIGPTVLRLPVESVVSKFYVKHVYTKDVYTGLKWDADLTWEEALQNFIFNMKDILRVK